MSENKIQRRRFLADLLFAGGALTAAALLARSAEAKTPPSPSPSPTRSPETPRGPERRTGGIAAPPRKPPAPPPPPPKP